MLTILKHTHIQIRLSTKLVLLLLGCISRRLRLPCRGSGGSGGGRGGLLLLQLRGRNPERRRRGDAGRRTAAGRRGGGGGTHARGLLLLLLLLLRRRPVESHHSLNRLLALAIGTWPATASSGTTERNEAGTCSL